MTRQRRIILDELRKTKDHPTADMLYQSVRRHLPRISLGTVYRNLEILAEAGMIRKLEFGGASRMRFDATVSRHSHIRCVACGRIDDFPLDPDLNPEEYTAGINGYEVLGYNLEFYGRCPACKAKVK